MPTFTPQAQITNQLQLGNALLGRAAQGPQSTAAASPIANLLLGISGGLNRSAGLGALGQNQQAQSQALQNIGEALRTGDFGGASAAALQSGVPSLANTGITLAGQGATAQRAAQTAARQERTIRIAEAAEARSARKAAQDTTIQRALMEALGIAAPAAPQVAGGAVGVTDPSQPFPTVPPGTAQDVGTAAFETTPTPNLPTRQTQQQRAQAALPTLSQGERVGLLSAIRKNDAKTITKILTGAEKRAKGQARKLTAATVVVQDIDRALGKVRRNPTGTTGVGGAFLSNLPGTDAKDVFELLQSVKANAGFDRLQAMRDASPTGGALGQVSNIELGLLQSAIGSLEQSQRPEQFQDNLRRVKNTYLDIIHGPGRGPTREALQFEQQQQPGPAQPAPSGVSEEDIKFTMQQTGLTRDQVLAEVARRSRGQ